MATESGSTEQQKDKKCLDWVVQPLHRLLVAEGLKNTWKGDMCETIRGGRHKSWSTASQCGDLYAFVRFLFILSIEDGLCHLGLAEQYNNDNKYEETVSSQRLKGASTEILVLVVLGFLES